MAHSREPASLSRLVLTLVVAAGTLGLVGLAIARSKTVVAPQPPVTDASKPATAPDPMKPVEFAPSPLEVEGGNETETPPAPRGAPERRPGAGGWSPRIPRRACGIAAADPEGRRRETRRPSGPSLMACLAALKRKDFAAMEREAIDALEHVAKSGPPVNQARFTMLRGWGEILARDRFRDGEEHLVQSKNFFVQSGATGVDAVYLSFCGALLARNAALADLREADLRAIMSRPPGTPRPSREDVRHAPAGGCGRDRFSGELLEGGDGGTTSTGS